MAYCQTNRWVANSAPYVKLVVDQSGHDGTTATLAWTLYYISDYPAEAGSKSYSVSIAGSTVASGSFNINGVTGTKVIASGTKKVNKTHSTQNISFGVSFNFSITWSGVYAGTLSASGSYPVTPKFSYTISYNANGGSGVPSAQTKWHGETLTLSSTKPTKSGYTFVGWGTSTTDTSADWTAGGSYTANSGRTLYAIWKKTITLTYSANGGSGPPSAQSATVYNATKNYTFTIPSTKPTRTGYTFLGWSTSASATTASYTSGKTITLSSNDTLYAVWKLITYTVKYDANGGTNAPASQTKKYGVDLTVSSTKPTRTGYTFLGWSVPDRGYDTAYYQPGGVIEYNGNQTLVAVWKINTYAVTYNANGGTNAPASQTKTYGTDLKLSTDVPTRQYYNFKGWATSKTGSVVYRAGGTYKTNAAVTLYAVWEVAYIKPRITAVSIIRCTKDEVPQDDGVYALLNFKWETDEPVTSIKIDRKLATAPDTSYSSGVYLDAKDTSGSVIRKVGGDLSVELAYNYRITVADSTDSNDYVATLPAALFPIDLLAGGKGVTIGGPAKEEGFIVKFMSKFKSDVEVDGALTLKQNFKYDSGTKVSTPIYIWDGDENGSGVAIGAGGAVVIGGGESARNFVTDMELSGTTEQTYITSDGNIYFYTNCNTIAEKKLGMYINTSGQLVLQEATYMQNNKGLYMKDSGGTYRDLFRVNATDTLAIGYGMYTGEIGDTRLYGKDLYLFSKGAINANVAITTTSDKREKENIVPLGASPVATYGMRRSVEQVDIHSELFDRLKPVQFNYINRADARTCFGLIAQDVLAALEELGFAENELDLVYGGVDTGEHTDRYGISYQNFTALLIHEVQKLKAKVMILEAERN